MLSDIKQNGQSAVKNYTLQFDKVDLENILVSNDEFSAAEKLISKELNKELEALNATYSENCLTLEKIKLNKEELEKNEETLKIKEGEYANKVEQLKDLNQQLDSKKQSCETAVTILGQLIKTYEDLAKSAKDHLGDMKEIDVNKTLKFTKPETNCDLNKKD